MRIPALDHGHKLTTKALMAFIRTVSRQRVPDVVKTLLYRPLLFGHPFSELLDRVMRGPSDWSAGERELFAGFTSLLNQCPF